MWWLLELPVNLRRYIVLAALLRRHMRRHPRIYGGVLLAVLLAANGYGALYHFYIQPARDTLAAYYEAIDNENYERAWALLDDDFQKRWRGGIEQFRSGYATTVKHTDLNVSDYLSLRQIFAAMFSKCVDVDVRYHVVDRFDRETFANPMQRNNELALELRYPSEYQQLMQDALPNDMSTIDLTRAYEKTATVSCKRGHWRISSLNPRAMAFEYAR